MKFGHVSHLDSAAVNLNWRHGHFAQYVAPPTGNITQLLESETCRFLVVVMLGPLDIRRLRPDAVHHLLDDIHSDVLGLQH
jgi:hypothetical protein